MGLDVLHFVSFFAVIISANSEETSKGQPAFRDNGILYANFKIHSNSYLNVTSIGKELVKGITECGFACVSKDSCFSFNLARNKALPWLCELLPSNLYSKADKVVTSQSYDHFGIPSPCSSEPCQNSGICEPVYETDSFMCLCGKRYTGRNCEKVDEDCSCLSELARKKSCETGYRLIFPGNRTVENYAMKQPAIASNLNAFSLCFFLKVIPDESRNHVISYAKDNANDLLIYFTHHVVGIYIGGEERTIPNILLADAIWHHHCFTWSNTNGEYKFYKDGKLKGQHGDFKKGHIIRSGGIMVLGQDQDSIGGGFDANQALAGELTELNMWDSDFSESDVATQYEICSIPHGSVLTWSFFKDAVHGKVQLAEP